MRRQRVVTVIVSFGTALLVSWISSAPGTDRTEISDSPRVPEYLQRRSDEFQETILPILQQYCWTCHSSERQEGDLDLERFVDLASVKKETVVWEHVLDQLSVGEMPPKDSPPLDQALNLQVVGWIRRMLDEVAGENAGDPGEVILRRLSNREYTYSIRDLTGVDSLDPAHEFPVDGAAGEGFTNAGAALLMSPALLQKYLDAAKGVAQHAVLLPDGIRFSPSDSQQDWTAEALLEIQQFYHRYTAIAGEAHTVQQGIALEVGSGRGRLPLQRYLDALQGRSPRAGLSSKYLARLNHTLTGNGNADKGQPSPLWDSLRESFGQQRLNADAIEAWQNVLWKFSSVGHIGRTNGPRAWQEPVSPLVTQQELRFPLNGDRDQTLYLVSGSAGDGTVGDTVIWENPRLRIAGQADLPVVSLPELLKHLETEREKIIDSTEACLDLLAGGTGQVDPALLQRWRNYLGLGETRLESLLTERLEGTPEYSFIQGWTGADALSVIANSSDSTVRVPGVMHARSIAMHPSPDRAAVVAWKSPTTALFNVRGTLRHAHPECGNGVAYSLEVRRGLATEQLAKGVCQGAEPIVFGPFKDIHLRPGQVIALVINPQNGDHTCDLTALNLTISDGDSEWDLTREVSPHVLAGNPQGPWHFLSQPASQPLPENLPQAVLDWLRAPSPALASKVREHLEKALPVGHPLLEPAIRSFQSMNRSNHFTVSAPCHVAVEIPADLARSAEFVVVAKLASPDEGSIQTWIQSEAPVEPITAARPAFPIIVGDDSSTRKRYESTFAEFRELFPIALCYERIVPVDEVVTLTLYYREDHHLKNLILEEAEIRVLDRLWDELSFVSAAPLRQVDAFEQIYEFATQDRPDLVSDFQPLREPIMQAAEAFKLYQQVADLAQRRAVTEFASRAWRRPLTESEIEELMKFPPRLMLVRVLTSPSFLYRVENVPPQTGAVTDWELATRMSYFLWSSIPDEELRNLASSQRLGDPEILAAQARRMLQDDKVSRLATEFGCQWLQVRDLATLDEKSERHFPGFIELRSAMQEEVTRFFIDLFQHDGEVLSLLDSDHTFVNGKLAEHYGFEVSGEDWQRVEGIRSQGRGGMLGFSATLAKNSGASRSSAILRGTWLSEVVLGEKLPNPPPGVPVLPAETPAGLTDRQLIELHSSDHRCAGCHKRIDPLGFALENFDAIGRLREADTNTILFDGTPVKGLSDLRNYLTTTRRDDFLRQFGRKLLGYSLGRSVQLSDQPFIETLVGSDPHRAGDMIERIVQSSQFRQIRGRNQAGGD
jgi:hypothetical protein